MPKKVLFCATVDTHFESFHLPYLKWFKEKGWEVDIAAGGDISLPYVDKKYTISIQRTPFSLKNFKAYQELKEILDKNHYTIIHCHTPMGGVLTRLAARKTRNQGTKVIYTAHGFHFFKGAPLTNWALYYPIEKLLSRHTDCLITINEEDYQLAVIHRFKAKQIEHVHGVGVNTEVFSPVSNFHKLVLRGEKGYKPEDFIMFYAAEFNKNKNQQLLIRALAQMKENAPTTKLLLAGDGALMEECKQLAISLGVEKMVHFLGFRSDIDVLLKMSDVAVASSFREGLPVNIMEAMASGIPVVASMNRGHSELINNGINGYVISPLNSKDFALRLLELYHSSQLQLTMGVKGREIMGKYSLSKVNLELKTLYSRYMVEEANEAKSKHYRAYI